MPFWNLYFEPQPNVSSWDSPLLIFIQPGFGYGSSEESKFNSNGLEAMDAKSRTLDLVLFCSGAIQCRFPSGRPKMETA